MFCYNKHGTFHSSLTSQLLEMDAPFCPEGTQIPSGLFIGKRAEQFFSGMTFFSSHGLYRKRIGIRFKVLVAFQ